MRDKTVCLEVSPSTKNLVERCCKETNEPPSQLIRRAIVYFLEPSNTLGKAVLMSEGFMWTVYDGFTAGDDKLGIRLISHMAHFLDANAQLFQVGGNVADRKRSLKRLDQACKEALEHDRNPKEKGVPFSLTTRVLYEAKPFFTMVGLVSARRYKLPSVWGKRFAHMFKVPKLAKQV